MARPGRAPAWARAGEAGSRRGGAAPAGAGSRELAFGATGELLDEAIGERVCLGIALEVTDRVSAADRVRLSEQVVAKPDLCVGVRTAHLTQGGTGPRADLVGWDPEQ
jgi:hypothetical protein